ncbi:MAG: type IV pilus twitching motility protein PilT [Deltaproteobacteria bacterium]|nr:type IV pilus twitching motility protein PilT [Deltaproteobacteria bacterium]MBI3390725.1 type IV pilus twitching motility protein PilT [Deltaproteobacteria bacterium]
MDLNSVLHQGVLQDASDILLKVGVPPAFRLHGDLVPLPDHDPLTHIDLQRAADGLMDEFRRRRFESDMQADLAYETPELGRFRVNVFRQRGVLSMVIRVIPSRIRNFTELNLPPVVERIANERRGLVLVTGTTGSGKSTTLAAMVNHINQTRPCHIITIEDPIEYTHRDCLSFVNQREVGYDTIDFAAALKAALRQNPDVILVGEMRDLETIETAIMAAETGHLVMSTLHTLDAPETLTRTISAFPEDQRDQARLILASVIKGVISQRLIPRADGQGMVPAVEVMVSSARVREYVADKNKARDLREVIAQGHTSYGMQTFDQSLMSLYRTGLITYDEALQNASNPADFALKVRGIASTSDSRWDNFERPAEQPDAAGKQKMEIERF